MSRGSSHAGEPGPSGQRFSEWHCTQRLGMDGQREATHPYPPDDVVTWIPGLDYRPGQRN
ncbi:MAG: hypothetical protein ACRDRP_04535 [Pseudonocardiaceae bacterium]